MLQSQMPVPSRQFLQLSLATCLHELHLHLHIQRHWRILQHLDEALWALSLVHHVGTLGPEHNQKILKVTEASLKPRLACDPVTSAANQATTPFLLASPNLSVCLR